ncbi:MAG TPA: PAC2 family protein, partial [Candidatus Norongarragalinales archaeon]|nr:PAC2 family protein [Candidatus Norongarragalinales archaeon]
MDDNRSFETSFIVEKSRPVMKNPILVAGLPGIGFVSKLAVDHLAKTLDAERFASLYSPHFPNQVIAMKSGRLRPFTMRFYHKKMKHNDLILLRGDLQPLTVEGQYEVSAKILDYVAGLGGKYAVAMAGYAVNRVVEKPKV